MSTTLVRCCEETDTRIIRSADAAIDFETFLQLNENEEYELINGLMEKLMAAGWGHEQLNGWLYWLVAGYVGQKNLGVESGSRTTVYIDEFTGRLPDLLFIRRENAGIIQENGVYGPPDLVIELVSPHDRPAGICAVETHYRTIGVPEIVFIDAQKRRVRLLRKRGDKYEETALTKGEMIFETVPGFLLQVEWIFADPRPEKFTLLGRLLGSG